ncbi:MAG: acetylxylan esterase [Phycisphaerae bacterium]|mgnify:FL=1|nr:acetylxylan esterase [Phycisphaerae bacterium]
MATRRLDVASLPPLDPVALLRRYQQAAAAGHVFEAAGPDEGRAWQRQVRSELAATLGFQDLDAVDFAAEVIEQVERGDHIRRKITIHTTRGKILPVYLLFPKSRPGPLPVVLAFHGHGYGVKDIIGLWEDGEERTTPDGYHKDFALELVRRGFLVAAPEIMAFGEHVPDQSHVQPELGQGQSPPCHAVATWAMMAGGSLAGLRVFEARRLVDYLTTLPEADTERLGAMGISGGGMHTFFSALVDERIRVAVISGYFCSWHASILAMHHCICNFIPGILGVGDLPELAALLAPRPVLIEAGTRDGIFPIEAVRDAVGRLREIYAVWDASNQIELDEFEGRHQISGRRAYDFLVEKLQRQSSK